MKDKHIVWELASTTIDQNTTLVTGGEYEVFLSFCGKDTRKAFTDFLYIYLVGAGIRTFRDNNELCVGEGIRLELLKAIKESKISIPIFSKSYAASKYCLLELTKMVECHRSEGQKIFPIFYNIKLSEVRHQTGSYEGAFSQHEKNFEGNVVQGWKDALRKVGELRGLELEETNGHEGELVKMVVEKVLLELKKNYKHVPDNVVGMDHHIQELMGLLNFNFDGVRIVGIHGMGGIGKTTIAKAVFNKLCDYFQCCCFIEDVREKAKHHNGLVNLQVQLDEPEDSTRAGSWSEDYADPIRVPSGPITRARAKKIKEALMIVVQELMNKAGAWRSIHGDGEQEWRIMLSQEDVE